MVNVMSDKTVSEISYKKKLKNCVKRVKYRKS